MSRRFQFRLRAMLVALGASSTPNNAPTYVITWRHRRPQFSLRTLPIAMLVVAVLAALAHYDHRVQVEQAQAELRRCHDRERQLMANLESGRRSGPPGQLREALENT